LGGEEEATNWEGPTREPMVRRMREKGRREIRALMGGVDLKKKGVLGDDGVAVGDRGVVERARGGGVPQKKKNRRGSLEDQARATSSLGPIHVGKKK